MQYDVGNEKVYPSSEQNQISLFSANLKSVRQLLRIQNTITKDEFSRRILQQRLPTAALRVVCRQERRICTFTLGIEGLKVMLVTLTDVSTT